MKSSPNRPENQPVEEQKKEKELDSESSIEEYWLTINTFI